VLGGTVFLGRHLTQAALERGHRLTLFTRGRHGAALFPEAEHLRGDRDGSLDALCNRRWDAVIDTSGYVPRTVDASARLLSDAAEHYCFVSTVSVYADLSKPGVTEDAPAGQLEDPSVEEVTGETYGPLKAACEVAVEAAFSGRAAVVRPGLIVGPFDPSARFAYWPLRFARGGPVLVPAPQDAPVQFVDGRDLGEWLITVAERRVTGVFNATGPVPALTMGGLVDAAMTVAPPGTQLVWVDEDFLLEHDVSPWVGLPLWLPAAADALGMSTVNCSRAIEAGLTFRPVEQTVADTLAWARDERDVALPDGAPTLSEAREAELLAAWARRAGAA